MQQIDEASANSLPEFIKIAHAAIEHNTEVQEIVRRLADFGLGVTVPHVHSIEAEFAPMPHDIVQVETNMVVSFAKRSGFLATSYVPVAWRWDPEGGISASGICSSYSFCSPGPMVHSPISGHTSSSGDG
jgi:hypothetical protein